MELSNYLTSRGHTVTLLIGEQATCAGERRAKVVRVFATTCDLEQSLRAVAGRGADAVFHAAAVSDFRFGKVLVRSPAGELTEIKAGKLTTRQGTLLAELLPTQKILARLRDWFGSALLVGWKFEVDGNRARALELARRQMKECRTDACVANGPAYGNGFGLVTAKREALHAKDRGALFIALTRILEKA